MMPFMPLLPFPKGGMRRLLVLRLFLPVTAVALGSLVLSMSLAWTAYRRWARESVMQDDLSRLSQSSATLTAFHNWLIPFLHSVRDDRDVVPLYNSEPCSIFTLVRGLNRMDTAIASGQALDALYVYNGPVGFYLSTDEGYEKPDEVDPAITGLIEESFVLKPYRYHPRTVGAGKEERKILAMMVGDLPIQGNLPLQRCLVAVIDVSTLSRDYFTGMDRRGTFRILDSEGQELLRTGPGRGFESLAGVFSDSGSVMVRHGGEPFAVSWLRNPDLDWWFVVESRLSGAAFAGDSPQIGMLLAILLVLTAALVVTYRTAWGLYRPLETLFPHMTFPGTAPKPAAGHSVFSEISLSVKRLGARLDEERVRRDWEQIRDFLEGNLGPKDAAALVSRIPEAVAAPAPWAVVALFLGGGSAEEGRESVEYLIMASSEDEAAGILGPYLAAGRTAGMGRPAENAVDLPRSAREAREALSHRFRFGTGRIIPHAALDMDPESPYDLPIRSVRRLLEKVNTGRLEAAGICLNEILEDLKDHKPEDFRMTLTLLTYELRRDLEPLSEIDATFGAVTEARLEEARRAETLEDASAAFLELFSAVRSRQENRHDDRSAAVADQARRIIERDLANPALCPDSVAGEIGLSTSYLRDVFKRVTGQSLSRAIQEIRMTECRKYLMETDLSVKDVAQATGFRNYNSFFSTFRRVVGLTPMEFRELSPDSTKN